MPQPGDSPNSPLMIFGNTGTVTVDFTAMQVAPNRPLPVQYGVLEHTVWFRLDAEITGMFTMQLTGPPGWQCVLEAYEKSAAWGSDAYYVDWWTLLDTALPGEFISVPVMAGQQVYIRAHPYNTNDAVTDGTFSWDLTPQAVAKFYGLGSITVVAGAAIEENKQIVAGVGFLGDSALEVVDYAGTENTQVGNIDFTGDGILYAEIGGTKLRRWRFHDHRHPHEFGHSLMSSDGSSESYTLPYNPYQMTSPHAAREFKYATGIHDGRKRMRVFETPHQPANWEFTGFIHTKQHHDELDHWARKDHPVQVTDHMRRTFEVVIQEFVPEDRRFGRHPRSDSLDDDVRWRMRYTMKCLILRRVS